MADDRLPEIFVEIWTKGLQIKEVVGFFYFPSTAAPFPWERRAPARHKERITSGACTARLLLPRKTSRKFKK